MPVTIQLVETATVDNPVVGDVFLKNGSYVVIGDTTGSSGTHAAAVAQTVRNRFLHFKEEWFLDKREGVPWFQSVLIKSPDLGAVRSLFRNIVNETPGVAETTTLDIEFFGKRRELEVTFKANLTDGTLLDSSEFAPFIVEV